MVVYILIIIFAVPLLAITIRALIQTANELYKANDKTPEDRHTFKRKNEEQKPKESGLTNVIWHLGIPQKQRNKQNLQNTK